MRHTPGPWEIREHVPSLITIGYSDGSVASVSLWSWGEQGDPAENRANAELIALAPAYKEAYEAAIEVLDWMRDPLDYGEGDIAQFEAARERLERAKKRLPSDDPTRPQEDVPRREH